MWWLALFKFMITTSWSVVSTGQVLLVSLPWSVWHPIVREAVLKNSNKQKNVCIFETEKGLMHFKNNYCLSFRFNNLTFLKTKWAKSARAIWFLKPCCCTVKSPGSMSGSLQVSRLHSSLRGSLWLWKSGIDLEHNTTSLQREASEFKLESIQVLHEIQILILDPEDRSCPNGELCDVSACVGVQVCYNRVQQLMFIANLSML